MQYSVIVPVYNCIAYLRACVESVPRMPGLEVLLIDDGSTDGSGQLCDVLCGEYPFVRVTHQENGGVSAARNRGIREAKGEYFLFLDADDTLDAALLQPVLAQFPEAGADMAFFGICFDYYSKENLYRSNLLAYPKEGLLEKKQWQEDFYALFMENVLSPVWAKILKKEILLDNNLQFDQQLFLYEDLEFVLRYLACCEKLLSVPQGIYHYRQSGSGASGRLRRIESLPRFLTPIEAALEQLGEVPQLQRSRVLLQIYLFLAREKIASADLAGIRGICADYAAWCQGRQLPRLEEPFQTRLEQGKAAALYLHNQYIQLRHRLAVAVKSRMKRGASHGH